MAEPATSSAEAPATATAVHLPEAAAPATATAVHLPEAAAPATATAAHQPEAAAPATATAAHQPEAEVGSRPLDIPVVRTPEVERWIAYFEGPGAPRFKLWLERLGRYRPLMQPLLEREGVPSDTIYLAVIESGLSPRALSRARAAGPWQFMATTGAAYGLEQSFWIDERRDPVKATQAAARHLRDLYDAFGDWHLAWAAYNGGPGRVRRAIAHQGTRSFFDLARRGGLRAETRDYVPKLIAAALIGVEPDRHGFSDLQPQPPFAFEVVEVADATDLGLVASSCGVALEEIIDLNPELLRFATPPVAKGAAPYAVRVPTGVAGRCREGLAAIPPGKRLTFRHHRVRPGETPGSIARRFGISTSALLSLNHIHDPRRMRAGRDLIIPVPARIPERLAREQAAPGGAELLSTPEASRSIVDP